MHHIDLLFLFLKGFDAEEDGSYGSQEFLNKIIVPNFIRQGVNIQVDFSVVSMKSVAAFHSKSIRIR